jgi:hypothetical protein
MTTSQETHKGTSKTWVTKLVVALLDSIPCVEMELLGGIQDAL